MEILRQFENGRFALLCLILILSGFAFFAMFRVSSQATAEPPNPAEVKAVTKWLKDNAILLKSVEPGQSFDDLKPLKKVFKDVRIVGLGEATHGGHEFFRFKHRMVEFLIKEMGFKILAFEASYPACLNINDYVLSGKGERAKALASQGFWTWDTEEIADLLGWLYEYNRTQPEGKKAKFIGFDMQIYNHAYEKLEPFLKKAAPDYLAKAGPDFLPAKLASNEFQQKSAEEKEKLKAQIKELSDFLSLNQARFTYSTSAQEFQIALRCSLIMAQFADMFSRPAFDQQNPANGGVARRDFHMAENIKFIVNTEGSDSRVIVWAHDSHISSANLGAKLPAMGSYLRQVYGPGYYALGATFGQGAFQSMNMDRDDQQKRGLTEFNLGPGDQGSVDWYFALPGLKNYLVDFRSSAKTPQITEWLNTSHMMRSIGSGFSTKWPWWQYTEPTVLQKRFDGMVFIETTTRARPNAMKTSEK